MPEDSGSDGSPWRPIQRHPVSVFERQGIIETLHFLDRLDQRQISRGPGIRPAEGEQEVALHSKRALLDYLREQGKKGLIIQRYKGLGEMNPEQLWETTMNPEKRTLLRVAIEDAIEADTIFTILMGDKVEPRREFIQNNALEVRGLDI